MPVPANHRERRRAHFATSCVLGSPASSTGGRTFRPAPRSSQPHSVSGLAPDFLTRIGKRPQCLGLVSVIACRSGTPTVKCASKYPDQHDMGVDGGSNMSSSPEHRPRYVVLDRGSRRARSTVRACTEVSDTGTQEDRGTDRGSHLLAEAAGGPKRESDSPCRTVRWNRCRRKQTWKRVSLHQALVFPNSYIRICYGHVKFYSLRGFVLERS